MARNETRQTGADREKERGTQRGAERGEERDAGRGMERREERGTGSETGGAGERGGQKSGGRGVEREQRGAERGAERSSQRDVERNDEEGAESGVATERPIAIASSLKGIDFPADRGTIVRHILDGDAEDSQAIAEVIEQLPDREYENAADVEEEYGRLGEE